MKSIRVSELKANLSRYLRLASRGARIVVTDRDDPIAQIGPPDPQTKSWAERLAREGRLRPGTQDWGRLKLSRPAPGVDIQAVLRDVREDPSEIRRR